MSVTIPIESGDAFFDLQATLDEVTYTLQFRWNVRLEAWFMDVLDSTGQTTYQSGLRLVANWPLNAYSTGRNPPGIFVAADSSSAVVGTGTDPGFDDLGDRVQLVYYTKADLGI